MSQISGHAAFFADWLAHRALPLWLRAGYDAEAGFFETVTQAGMPGGEPVRSRVNPRQIFCLAEAGRRGWAGDWRSPVESALARYDRVYRRADGFYGHLATPEGELIDDRFDLYNHAFVLLGFAAIAEALPERRDEMAKRADALLAALKRDYAHPLAGFEEARPPVEPLKANPHMHLLEAALAWETAHPERGAAWRKLADEIAELALTKLIDPATGAVREFFDRGWQPMQGAQGRVVEPGHQFEWAWLLARWALRRDRPDVIDVAARLFSIGETHGIDPLRDVAVMEIDADFTVADPLARLWSQTEWLKAALLLASTAEGAERQRYLASASRAASAIRHFLSTPLVGLWWDKQHGNGHFEEEAAPASTFYHLVSAIFELNDRAAVLDPKRACR